MHIHLVRHGRDTRQGDRKLTAQGRCQARAVADRFARHGVTDILTAAPARARETAEEISRATGTVAEIDDRLDEIRPGPIDDAGLPGPRERLRERVCGPDAGGAETWDRFLERVSAFLSELCRVSSPQRQVVLVTHSGVFDAMFEILCGTGQRVELAVAHTAVTHWQYRPGNPGGSWVLHSHNDTAHLGHPNHAPATQAAGVRGDAPCR
ncbi:histidine phosphatase family protein [Streptomyces sp. NPDC059104]|uniref:histidine phosphatase family protein n=1 Tax=Streptomyces sp. NPDC059104 TaxID=3346729 RepID=UPI0036A898FF